MRISGRRFSGDVPRVYADTSVFGGAFDEEFSAASREFFDQARDGYFRLAISSLVEREIRRAPATVQDLYHSLEAAAEMVDVTLNAVHLRQA